MAELSIVGLHNLLATTVEANKETMEAGQTKVARISEINKALNKLTILHQDLARNTNKVDVMLDRLIYANSTLDRSIAGVEPVDGADGLMSQQQGERRS
jgi:hypothetical protein